MRFYTLNEAEQYFQAKSQYERQLVSMTNAMNTELDTIKKQWYQDKIDNNIIPLVNDTATPFERIVAILKLINYDINRKQYIVKYDLVNNNTDVLICTEHISETQW